MRLVKDRNLVIFRSIKFLSAGASGVGASFMNLHFEQNIGLTGTQIGTVSFVVMLILLFIKPLIGFLADRATSYIFYLRVALVATTVVTLFFSQARTFTTVLIFALLHRLAQAPLGPLETVVVADYCDKVKYDFGKIRVFVSLGFLLCGMLAGFFIAGLSISWFGRLIGFRGFLSIPAAIFGSSMIAAILAFVLWSFVPEPKKRENEKKERATLADVKQLFSNKSFIFILLFSMMSLIVVEAAKMYLSNHLVLDLGGSETIVSWMMLVQVGPELLILPSALVLFKKIGFKNWYLFSVATMILRMLVYATTTNLNLIVIMSSVHGIAVCTSAVGNVYYLRKIVPANLMAFALTLLGSANALSSAVLALIFGFVYEHTDAFMIFRMTTVILVGALILVVCSKSLKTVGLQITEQS
jgi:PPP family 3-phenylpropionic acid transporter